MNYGMRNWARGVVAACGLALAILAAGTREPAGADEMGAATDAAAAADFAGSWQFVEDRTAPEHGRDSRERPPLGANFKVALDGQTLVVEQTGRGATLTSRVALDGSESVQKDGTTTRTTSGRIEAGALTMIERRSAEREGKVETAQTDYTLTPGKDGLLVRMQMREPVEIERTALYRRASEVPAPKAAKGDLGSLAWLEGRFTVTSTSTSTSTSTANGEKTTEIEEHWGPAGGGAMLGTARTVAGGLR